MIKGIVLFEGASLLDGAPIAVIATLKTSNRKTGNMIQTWILRSDVDPVEASKQKLDSSICGTCPHKQNIGGACYVNIGQAPLSVYRAYKRGAYEHFNLESHAHLFEGRKVRLGAYGDPAAAPFEVWETITDLADGHTGYTHQIRHANFDDRLIGLCMVSADSPKQALKVHAHGGRTFRVSMAGDSLLQGEIECLADSKGLACNDCGLCDGAGTKPSIAITVHGTRAKNFKTSLIPMIQEA